MDVPQPMTAQSLNDPAHFGGFCSSLDDFVVSSSWESLFILHNPPVVEMIMCL